MARGKTDLLSRLADRGEEAISRFGDVPGGKKLLESMTGMRDRLDDVQKRLRGLEGIEKRLTALERKVDRLASGTKTTRRGTTARKATPRAKGPGAAAGPGPRPAPGKSSETPPGS